MGLLEDIVAQKHDEARALARVRFERPAGLPIRDVAGKLRRSPGDPLRLIAEIKFRSPSAGALSRVLSAEDRARAYEGAGASMLSVLTDGRWFGGSFDDLSAARAAVGVPVLCKDFVVDAAQIGRAWSAGADAVLLIVRCLGGDRLQRLVDAVRARGLEPFVEVRDEPELDRALAAGARVVGVNARDLDTLKMDLERTARVLARIPEGIVAVHLSGLATEADAARVARSRADAALLGEALMRQDDPRDLLARLVEAAK